MLFLGLVIYKTFEKEFLFIPEIRNRIFQQKMKFI